jgi:hypothetical protein
MAKIFGFSAAIGLAAAQMSGAAAQSGDASVTIPLANGNNQCIDVSKKTVTLWLTSIMLQEHNGWLSQTNGIGAEADLTLTSSSKGAQTFPGARQLSTNGLVRTNLVRANLAWKLLVQYDFSKDNSITGFDIPVTLLSSQGDSQVATYAKALIKVTQSMSGLVPDNPFAPGVGLGGKLANAFLTNIPHNDVSRNSLPSFEISHTLSRGANCNDNDLMDGVHAKIGPVSGSPVAGTIATNQINYYCFYKINDPSDPDIGYMLKPTNGSCPASAPPNLAVLENPHIIYVAYGVTPLAAANTTGAQAVAANAFAEYLSVNPARAADVMRAKRICASVGIADDRCFEPR